MSPSLVSVIIPAYNVAPYLEGCIQSVVNQTYQERETILVDDCSTDRSLQIALRYALGYPLPYGVKRGMKALVWLESRAWIWLKVSMYNI